MVEESRAEHRSERLTIEKSTCGDQNDREIHDETSDRAGWERGCADD